MFDHLSIMGILVDHRAEAGPQVQEILTRHGDKILARHGIPDLQKKDGIITLTLNTDESGLQQIQNDLRSLHGVEAQYFQMR
jgi:hypothetical protein